MDLSIDDALHGFTVRTRETLPEIDGIAYTLTHHKSGAKLLYLQNEDNNKAFSISFKTPPANDTGVFHILEHSVLCGSDRFPVKEPFVDLLKSSMQTFLNAMTFPDKTMYPVASTNEKDLYNLMDVYLDAVLHPNIYHKRAIFEQEGWHFEIANHLESGEEEGGEPQENSSGSVKDSMHLLLNGVVYNEMKGALSDPNAVLYDELQTALFPCTAYRFESGGTPRAIPELTYEEFLEEHRRHYRLNNSYLTLYGNLDIEGMLAFLDQRYLSPVATEEHLRDEARKAAGKEPLCPHALEEQAAVVNLAVSKTMATAPENACVGLGYVVGHARERTRMVAVDILFDALLGSNEAPVKRALLDAQLADDVQAFLADASLQPFAVIQLRGSQPQVKERFRSIFEDALRRVVDEGIDHALIEASLSRAEFIMREGDFGIADGVALSMAALSGWLYDDELATSYLRYENDFAFLRKELKSGYFEQLISEVFLQSKHCALAEIVPTDKDDTYEAEFLAAAEATKGPDDFERIAAQEATLRRLQTEPDLPQALATLPRLSVSDIGEAPCEAKCELLTTTPLPCLRHHLPTHGLVYTYRYFNMNRLLFEDLPYVTILGLVLGKLGTATHTASEIDTLINGRLGNLSFFAEIYEGIEDSFDVLPQFVVSASALSENVAATCELPLEIMLTSRFNDTSKIKDVLQQRRISMEQNFANAGHSAAMARVSSYYLPASVLREQMGGVEFYRFLKDLLANFDKRASELTERLNDLATRLFCDDDCTLSFTGSDESFAAFWEATPQTGRPQLSSTHLVVPAPAVLNEAFIVPTDVCYAAQGFDRRAFNEPYTGAWQVASKALSFDYLWNEVRVKGGAYGAGFQSARTGTLRFYSYRDPHLDETYERFAQAAAWLSDFNPDDKTMEGYVVSTVAGFDAPQKARMQARRQDGDFFGKRTPEMREETRREMISTQAQTVRALAPTLAQAVQKQAICAFGNKDILASARTKLNIVDLLNE